MSRDISVVIPVINEGPNLAVLLPRLAATAAAADFTFDIIVVDGGSSDDTVKVAAAAGARVVPQKGKGYGAAVKTGLALAEFSLVVTMDADQSHSPDFIVRMAAAAEEAELVIASRYTGGGSAEVSFFREILSHILNGTYRYVLDLPYRDLSSGFRLYHKRLLEEVHPVFDGYEFLPEMLVRAHCAGFKVKEVPFHYDPRTEGASHVRLFRFGIAYLRCLWAMWKLRNSISAADYDWRAFYSRHFFQRWWQRKRHRHIRELAGHRGRVLDVGCGSSKIAADYPLCTAVDISWPKLRFLRRTNDGIVHASAFSLPFPDESFDTVVCSQLIEHLAGDEVIAELDRVLRREGTLVIGTPDYGKWIWPTIEFFYGVFNPLGYKDKHISRYTEKGLRIQLENLGYEITARRSILEGELIFQAVKHFRPGGQAEISPSSQTGTSECVCEEHGDGDD